LPLIHCYPFSSHWLLSCLAIPTHPFTTQLQLINSTQSSQSHR
jgi:hypothetical protein